MHILISSVGSAGDVHPFLAIGQALQRRGHRVDLQTSVYFAERVRRAGLGFLPVGDLADYQRAVDDPDLWHPRRSFSVVWRDLSRLMEEAYQQLLQHCQPDTVLVGSTMAIHSRLAQETQRLPGVTVHLSPACLMSAEQPAAWAGLGWLDRLPPWAVRPLLAGIERLAIDPVMLPELTALRARLGLAPVRRVMSHWINATDRVICAFPAWFAQPQSDWPPASVATGFCQWPAEPGSVLDPLLERFIQAGPPPIAFTPGSAMAHGRQFFEQALAACQALGRRAVLITPYREQLPAQLPPFARQIAYVPFDLLAPRVAAFVHHGGVGTTAQLMAAGVPQLITPFAHDQFDNARRVVRLGVGSALPPTAKQARWIATLLQLSDDRAMAHACHELALRMAQEPNAAQKIAEQIESLRRR